MYKRHRFPPEIIQHVVWLNHRFNLSSRDIEDLMAERGIAISYESIRLWCIKFGSKYAKRLKQRHRGYGDTLYIDEVFVKIRGVQQYLWRAVDQDGEVVDVFLQRRRDGAAAKRFLKRLLRANGNEPRRIVTDKFRSYGVAQRFLSNHAAVYNLFNLDRHLISAEHYRIFRPRSLPLVCNAPLRLGNVPQPSSSRIQRKPFEAES